MSLTKLKIHLSPNWTHPFKETSFWNRRYSGCCSAEVIQSSSLCDFLVDSWLEWFDRLHCTLHFCHLSWPSHRTWHMATFSICWIEVWRNLDINDIYYLPLHLQSILSFLFCRCQETWLNLRLSFLQRYMHHTHLYGLLPTQQKTVCLQLVLTDPCKS